MHSNSLFCYVEMEFYKVMSAIEQHRRKNTIGIKHAQINPNTARSEQRYTTNAYTEAHAA